MSMHTGLGLSIPQGPPPINLMPQASGGVPMGQMPVGMQPAGQQQFNPFAGQASPFGAAGAQQAAPMVDDGSLGTLAPGTSGEQVKALQSALQQIGVYRGPIDGRYNAATTAGVKAFQAQTPGLKPTGLATGRMRLALREVLVRGPGGSQLGLQGGGIAPGDVSVTPHGPSGLGGLLPGALRAQTQPQMNATQQQGMANNGTTNQSVTNNNNYANTHSSNFNQSMAGLAGYGGYNGFGAYGGCPHAQAGWGYSPYGNPGGGGISGFFRRMFGGW